MKKTIPQLDGFVIQGMAFCMQLSEYAISVDLFLRDRDGIASTKVFRFRDVAAYRFEMFSEKSIQADQLGGTVWKVVPSAWLEENQFVNGGHYLIPDTTGYLEILCSEVFEESQSE